VFICHPEPQLKRCHFESQLKECHVLNLYPKSQLKGYVRSHNSRNTSKPTFEVSPKPCRSRISKACKTLLPQQSHLALLTSRQAQSASKPFGGGYVPPGAKRHCTPCLFRYCLARLLLPPSATHSCCPLNLPLLLGGSHTTARRHTNTHAVLVLAWVQLQFVHTFTHKVTQPVQLSPIVSIRVPTIHYHHHIYYIKNLSIKIISLRSLSTHSLTLILCSIPLI